MSCSIGTLIGSECGTKSSKLNITQETIPISLCQKDVSNHLHTTSVTDISTEYKLILTRTGVFEYDEEYISRTTVCPKHWYQLGGTLRAVVSPGRTLRERNNCKQLFDFQSSMHLHVAPMSKVKWRHFLLIRGEIMTCVPGPGSGGVDRKSWSWVVHCRRAPQSGCSTLIFPLKHW